MTLPKSTTFERRRFVAIARCVSLCSVASFAFLVCSDARASAKTLASPGGSAAERLTQPGPQSRELARRTGTWNVTTTFRLAPDAAPTVVTGAIAQRTMVGRFLEEVMRPAPHAKIADFRRVAYLSYSRLEGRWQYVSMDTRNPDGIMPALSYERETNGKVTLEFAPLSFVGLGAEVDGRLYRSNLVITRDGDDHELVEQYFVRADGTGREWRGVRYEYTRKR